MVKTGRSPAVPPLEEAVRCPLLDRDPEVLAPVPARRGFLPVARRVLQESWIIVLEKLLFLVQLPLQRMAARSAAR